MSTRVHITVDTEFSIGGAFAVRENRRPVGASPLYCERHETPEGLRNLMSSPAREAPRKTYSARFSCQPTDRKRLANLIPFTF